MSKKKKNKEKNLYKGNDIFMTASGKSKKNLNKDFNKALKDIERMQISLMEADKKARKKERRKINKKESEFYTSMGSIKCRKKMAKEWEKTGFLDSMLELLHRVSPLIKLLAKSIACLIIAFLSIDAIKRSISPETLSKITTLFDLAMAV